MGTQRQGRIGGFSPIRPYLVVNAVVYQLEFAGGWVRAQ